MCKDWRDEDRHSYQECSGFQLLLQGHRSQRLHQYGRRLRCREAGYHVHDVWSARPEQPDEPAASPDAFQGQARR